MITTTTLDNFREAFTERMKALEEEFGIAIELGNIRYGSDHFTATIKAIERAEGEEESNLYELEYKKYAKENYLNPDAIGTTVTVAGKQYEFIGMRPGRSKNKCIIKSNRGAEYLCSVDSIISDLRY